jgi:outer membrane protein assembly factor BamB
MAITDTKSVPENPVHEPRWIAANATQFLSEDANYAYLLSSDNHIVAVDLKTGAQAFQSSSSDLVAFGANTKGDGIVYGATADGHVVAVKPVLTEGTAGEMVMDFKRVNPTAVADAR